MAYLPVEDFGNPKAFGAKAMETISAGNLVFASGADNVVTSAGVSSFALGDITVAAGGSGAQVVGVARAAAVSGASVAIQKAGLVVLPANGVVTASFPVSCDGNQAVANAGSATMASGFLGRALGRALTSAASGGYCVVDLGL